MLPLRAKATPLGAASSAISSGNGGGLMSPKGVGFGVVGSTDTSPITPASSGGAGVGGGVARGVGGGTGCGLGIGVGMEVGIGGHVAENSIGFVYRDVQPEYFPLLSCPRTSR